MDNKAILERVNDEEPLISDYLLKYKDVEAKKFGDFKERQYPVGVVFDMMKEYAEDYCQYKLKQETHIETPWDWFGWLQARIPNLEPKHKFWVQQCVRDLANIRIKQLAPSDEEIENYSYREYSMEEEYAFRKGSKWVLDQFINPENKIN